MNGARILLVAILVVIVGIASLYAYRATAPSSSPSPAAAAPKSTASSTATVATSTAIVTPIPATPSPTAPGTITGALAFPSDFIPTLTVYAVSVADPRTFFTVATPRYPLATNTPRQPSYTIAGITPGTYYVLAYRDDNAPQADERPGVHSQYVVCGSGQNCKDHSLAPVTVRAGETVAKIDVTDWYYPPEQRYPSRPR